MSTIPAIKIFFDWSHLVDSGLYETIDFASMPNGHLVCESCAGAIWCDHIQMMVEDNGDSKVIFDDLESKDLFHIEVPVFPKNNLWQRVSLDAHHRLHAYVVNIEYGSHTQNLGFLNPGEGRNVLRSMVLSWFRGMVDIRSLSCQANSHGYAEQLTWEMSLRSYATGFPNLFSVWQNKTCLACAFGFTADDDLVPDAGDSSKKPWEK